MVCEEECVCVCTQGGFCGVKLCVKERMGVVYEWKDGWPVCVCVHVV